MPFWHRVKFGRFGDPRNTSQMCSRCGSIVKKDLSVRYHNCPYCGLNIDRDINAAINILDLALRTVTDGVNPR
jgi:putative transposase